MKISLNKKTFDDGGAIYFTTLFGQRVTLSKALVQREKDAGRFAKEMETSSDWLLIAATRKSGEKTYTNFYFTLPKPKESAKDDEGELPF